MAVAEPPSPIAAAPRGPASGRLTYQPRITANRRQIDDRFPSLGFTIDTGGLAFFEVLLTTDPALFDPANAGRRSDANFYSSRKDGGLLPAAQAVHPFLVPSAVLRGFAAASPRPSALRYTLIAYESGDGAGPAFAHPPASLGSAAPSVIIARDFTGNTLAMVLSVSVHKLRRLGSAAGDTAPTPDEDAGEREDGYGAPPPTAVEASLAAIHPYQPAPPSPYHHPADTHDSLSQVGSRPMDPVHPDDVTATTGYQLAVLPGPVADPAGASRPARTPIDPLLPGQRMPATRRPPDQGIGYGHSQSAEFEADDPEPYDLVDDGDQVDYRSDTSMAAGRPAYAVDIDAHPGAYQSLDDPVAPEPGTEAGDARAITVDDKMRIIEHIAPFESGGDYGAINPDGEFAGRFGTNHPAYQRYHVGLSYGVIQFTQDSGTLGQLLVMMRDRDAATFTRIFGSDADRLIEVTTATGPGSSQSPDGRSARVQQVAGADLWDEPWVSRFRAAGGVEAFRAAQRELAARAYLDPMLQFAGWMGLDSERALTIAVDRAIQMGVHGARRWISEAAGPLSAPATRQQALVALGCADLRSFQASVAGLDVDGEWGPNTHAAMVGALRALGSASPVPIPTTDQMVEMLARRAASEPWHARLETLRTADLPSVRYKL